MIRITKKFRAWALKKWTLDAATTDAELREFVGRKLFRRLVTLPTLVRAGAVVDSATPAPRRNAPTPTKTRPAPGRKTPSRTPADGSDDTDRDSSAVDLDAAISRGVSSTLKKLGITGRAAGDVDPSVAFGQATRVRVKEAADNYSTSRKGACYPATLNGKSFAHPWAGRPARYADVNLDHPSDRDKAVALAYLRFQCSRSPVARMGGLPRWLRSTDHDRELLLYAAHNEKWTGVMDTADGELVVDRKKLTDYQIKTLLDDSNSGGIEITPVVFDDALILTPVLYGELFPFVRVENVARGRRVKGGAIVNPTFTSGIGEGTAITPFNTASFVTAFDTAIYPAVAAIELGQDFEEDSPVDLGGQIVEQFGLKALEWLDRVVAVGNGYNEPQGFFNATAATLVSSVFGVGGPMTVSDYEGLMFGVPKQFRTEAGAYLAYVSNDYTYRKARAIAVGPGDERRVFGMDHQAYTLLGTDYKVQNDIADGQMAFVNLRRFRMYRRLGMQVRVETGGRQLALSNTRLIVVRMRYGGQLEIGGAAAVCRDAQST